MFATSVCYVIELRYEKYTFERQRIHRHIAHTIHHISITVLYIQTFHCLLHLSYPFSIQKQLVLYFVFFTQIGIIYGTLAVAGMRIWCCSISLSFFSLSLISAGLSIGTTFTLTLKLLSNSDVDRLLSNFINVRRKNQRNELK